MGLEGANVRERWAPCACLIKTGKKSGEKISNKSEYFLKMPILQCTIDLYKKRITLTLGKSKIA